LTACRATAASGAGASGSAGFAGAAATSCFAPAALSYGLFPRPHPSATHTAATAITLFMALPPWRRPPVRAAPPRNEVEEPKGALYRVPSPRSIAEASWRRPGGRRPALATRIAIAGVGG
jgi:hypothetical protein